MSANATVHQYTDLQGLAALRRDAKAQDPAALREAARQFESVFTRMMLQSMRQASGEGEGMLDSQQSLFYRDMFDDQLAVELSRGRGLGLAEMLVAQLMRAGLAPPTPPGAPAQSIALDPKAAIVAPLVDEDRILPAAAALRPIVTADRAAPGLPAPAPAPSAVPARASGAPPAPPAPSASVPPRTAARPGSREAFLEAIMPAAEAAARTLGVSPRNLIAQAALETGWGRSLPRSADGRLSFNFFGIKATGAWKGPSVAAATTEVLGGRERRMVERFRAYTSIEESVADHARLLGQSRRYAAVRGTGDDAHAFGAALQRGGYATDPSYARKIVQVAESVGRLMARRDAATSAPADGAGRGDPVTQTAQRAAGLKSEVTRPMTVSDLRNRPGRT